MFTRSWNSAHSSMCTYVSLCHYEVIVNDVKKFGGSVKELIDASHHSAVKLIELLVNNFSSYKDIAVYKGRRGLHCFIAIIMLLSMRGPT